MATIVTVMAIRRKELGNITQIGLAQQCTDAGVSVSQADISLIENAQIRPRPELRDLLTKLLELEHSDYLQMDYRDYLREHSTPQEVTQ